MTVTTNTHQLHALIYGLYSFTRDRPAGALGAVALVPPRRMFEGLSSIQLSSGGSECSAALVVFLPIHRLVLALVVLLALGARLLALRLRLLPVLQVGARLIHSVSRRGAGRDAFQIESLYLDTIPASAAAKAAVYEARANLKDPDEESESVHEESGSESEQDEEGEDDSEDGEEDD